MLIRLESAFLRELHVLQTPRSGLVTLEMTPILVKLPSSPSAPSPSTPVWDSRSVGDGRDTEDSLGPNLVGPHSSWWPPGGRKGAEPGAPAGKQPQAAVYPIKSSAAGHPQPGQHCSLSAECVHGHHLTGKCFHEASGGKVVGWKKGKSDLNP